MKKSTAIRFGVAGVLLIVLTLLSTLYPHLNPIGASFASSSSSSSSSSTFRSTFTIPLSSFPDLKGPHYRIYHPLADAATKLDPPLLNEPEVFMKQYQKRFEFLDTKTTITTTKEQQTLVERARQAYAEFLILYVTGLVFGRQEQSVQPNLRKTGRLPTTTFDADARSRGEDWPYLGVTMTGRKRLENVQHLIAHIVRHGIPGDYIETGVWRGGNSAFARALWRSHGEGQRRSFVCDSFQGLPPGDRELDKHDKNWDQSDYLKVSDQQVADLFQEMGVLDPNVIFVKGFFNESIPPLAPHIEKLAIMRLDGDMYESTVDVLYPLYEKLSIGGYVIMDDWNGFPSQTACLDFFRVHNMTVDIQAIDDVSAYWQKTQEIQVQHWRYEKSVFRDDSPVG